MQNDIAFSLRIVTTQRLKRHKNQYPQPFLPENRTLSKCSNPFQSKCKLILLLICKLTTLFTSNVNYYRNMEKSKFGKARRKWHHFMLEHEESGIKISFLPISTKNPASIYLKARRKWHHFILWHEESGIILH